MRHKVFCNCFRCGAKTKSLIKYKGREYCNACYRGLTGVMPKLDVKKMRCSKCAREGFVPYDNVMSVCPSCQVAMEEVGI